MTNKITVPSELIHRAIDAIEQVGYQDKFIDYTFVRAVKQELRAALAEPTIGIDHETMRARYTDPEAVVLSSGTGSTLRVVVAEPAPPAGGEPEVFEPHGWAQTDGPRINAFTREFDIAEEWAMAGYGTVELLNREHVDDEIDRLRGDHQAHITRLQAEVEQWKLAHRLAMQDNIKLQSELTKARELLAEGEYCGPARWQQKVAIFLQSNQFAPDDKGQGEPVGLQHMAVAEDGKLRWMSGRKMQNCELYALPDGSAIRFPLYAEPPAPVAVVMPSRDNLRDIIAQAIGGDTYDCTRVWSAWGVGTMSEDDFVPVVDQESRLYEMADACLDELARLNSEPKP